MPFWALQTSAMMSSQPVGAARRQRLNPADGSAMARDEQRLPLLKLV